LLPAWRSPQNWFDPVGLGLMGLDLERGALLRIPCPP